jgi:hypothetical protein
MFEVLLDDVVVDVVPFELLLELPQPAAASTTSESTTTEHLVTPDVYPQSATVTRPRR